MKIIKEEVEENECPKCGRPLDFMYNEMKKSAKFIMLITPWKDPTTGDGWFHCEVCNKSYLIENYAEESETD